MIFIILGCILLGMILHSRFPLHGKKLVIAQRFVAGGLLTAAIIVLATQSTGTLDFIGVALLVISGGVLIMRSLSPKS